MLRIRKKQMEQLETLSQARFESEMLPHLRATYPQQMRARSDAELKSLISLGVRKALGYKMEAPPEIRLFVECVALFGVNFDEEPAGRWVQEVFQDESLNWHERVTWVYDELVNGEPRGEELDDDDLPDLDNDDLPDVEEM